MHIPYRELRVEGLEPPHISAPEPKSGVSTNFTILACGPSNVRESSLESSGFVGKLLTSGGLSKCPGVIANPQFGDFFQTFETILDIQSFDPLFQIREITHWKFTGKILTNINKCVSSAVS